MTRFLLIVATTAIGAARAEGLKALWFQAIAHLFVGGLFGAWFASQRVKYFESLDTIAMSRDPFYFFFALVLTIVEVACFFLVK